MILIGIHYYCRPVVPGGAGGAIIHYYCRPVVPGGAGGAMAPPIFGRSVNPISTKGGRLCPPNNTGTPGFSDLPTALQGMYYVSHAKV